MFPNVQFARGSSAHRAGNRIACPSGATSACKHSQARVSNWGVEKAGGQMVLLQITTCAILGWGLQSKKASRRLIRHESSSQPYSLKGTARNVSVC